MATTSTAPNTLTVDGKTYYTEKAVIESAELGLLASTHLGVSITFELSDGDVSGLSVRRLEGHCATYIEAVLGAARVERWTDLPGKKVLVLRESNNRFGFVVGFASRKHPENHPFVQAAVLRSSLAPV